MVKIPLATREPALWLAVIYRFERLAEEGWRRGIL